MSEGMKPGDPEHLEAVAASFRAAGEFFSGLGDPEQARRVVDALLADDPGQFREFLDRVPPFPGKCPGLCGLVRNIVEGGALEEKRLCTLKRDLTRAQRLLAHRIYEKHFGRRPAVIYEPPPTDFGEDVSSAIVEIIWPGPYQDELHANGLVDCWLDKVPVLTWSLGPPSWECPELCL
jgi:hypothetical protein